MVPVLKSAPETRTVQANSDRQTKTAPLPLSIAVHFNITSAQFLMFHTLFNRLHYNN